MLLFVLARQSRWPVVNYAMPQPLAKRQIETHVGGWHQHQKVRCHGRPSEGAENRARTRRYDRSPTWYGGTFIKVHADPAYGWHATVMTAPAQAVRTQQTVEEIAKELRALYDLKKE
jgi:hypothetical protein